MNKTINLHRIVIPQEVLDLLPAAFARRQGILPVNLEGETLLVIQADPENDNALIQLEAQIPYDIRVLQAEQPDTVSVAIRRYYPEHLQADDGSPLALFERLVSRALQLRCSDIHIDPAEAGGAVRLRIDGMLRLDRTLPPALTAELVQTIKVAAELDIAEKRVPQDGQISMRADRDDISMRVATVPTIHGEKVTLRLLATAAVADELSRLDALGMTDRQHAILLDILDQAHGILLLSGPTGSGKTTTLYAALRHLRQPGTRHILSIEDPVEIPLDGINQVHVDSERVSFNAALRSALRHDPDIIMIGEIRDAETADIAVKSAMTGHLVLSTLHTNTAIGVITRLLNLGITREQLVSTVRAAIAQRLVRRPCPHCMTWTPPDETATRLLGTLIPPGADFPATRGCSFCGATGYAGRTGLYEMAALDKTLRARILAAESEDALLQHLTDHAHYLTLIQDGIRKAAEGRTTLAEVLRAAYTGETT